MTVFNLHTDPGHGWLEVTFADLSAVGISPKEISAYSYVDTHNGRLYLEEDCDAAIFIGAYVAKHDRLPEIKELYRASTFVRRLPRLNVFNGAAATA